MRRALLVLVFAAAWGPGLTAADFYRYQTEAGTVSYADEEGAIPTRYRDSAERVSKQALGNYGRLTPVAAGADPDAPTVWEVHVEREEERAERLREPRTAYMGLADSANLEFPVERGTIAVSRRGFWKDGAYRSALVVEQDGEILAVIESGRITGSREFTLD